MEYKGIKLGYKVDHIPDELPAAVEEAFFSRQPYEGSQKDYKKALVKLDEVVADAMGAALDRVAPVLSEGVLARVRKVATPEELSVIDFWQGRVTPFAEDGFCAVRDGLWEMWLLPGEDEDVRKWWLETFCMSRGYWSSYRSDIHFLQKIWSGREVVDGHAANAVRSVLEKIMRSFVDKMCSVVDIAEFKSRGDDARRVGKVLLSEVAESYVKMVRYAANLLANTGGDASVDEDGSAIKVYTLQELDEMVAATGIDYERDCGPIGSIAQMRDVIRSSEEVVVPCVRCDSWVKSFNGYGVSCPYHMNMLPEYRAPDMEQTGYGTYEDLVYGHLVAKVPSYEHEAMVMRLALLHNTTPEHIRICLDKDDADCPRESGCESGCAYVLESRERCAFADSCPSLCGELQRRGRGFPVTDNGNSDSCRTYFFLNAALGQEGEEREQTAKLHVLKFQEDRERRNNVKKNSRAADRSAEKAVEKADDGDRDGSKQASLF